MRPTDNGNPILACMDVEDDVTFYFRDKVRVHNKQIYQCLQLLAVQYQVAEQEMASTLFFSTILSFITMGAFIWLTA